MGGGGGVRGVGGWVGGGRVGGGSGGGCERRIEVFGKIHKKNSGWGLVVGEGGGLGGEGEGWGGGEGGGLGGGGSG